MGRLITYIVLLSFLSAAPCLGQDSLDQAVKSFRGFQRERPSQQLQFVFNQGKYAPGDTVYFKTYLLDANLNLWRSAQIIEFSLLNQKGGKVYSGLMKSENGIGYNQLVLPETIKEGFYNFTAFTNWMRNFGVNSMYQRQIEVVVDKPIAKVLAPLEAAVEGGELIDKVPANLVVRSNNADTLFLMGNEESMILKLLPDDNGYARFRFVPESGLEYSIRDSNGQIALPKVIDRGFNIFLMHISEEFLRLRVLGKPSPSTDKTLNLIISSQGFIYYQQRIDPNTPFQTNIDRSTLTPGIHEISLLDDEGKLLAFREFYSENKNSIEPVLTTNLAATNSRSKIDFELNLTNKKQPVEGEFSVSVLNAEAFGSEATLDMAADIYLTTRMSDLPLSVKMNDREELIDNILILRSKEIDWSKIQAPMSGLPVYGLSSLYQLRGIARNAETNELLPTGSTLMFYLQKDLMRYEVPIGLEGRFELNILDVYGEDELFVMAETPRQDELMNIDIEWTNFPFPDFEPGAEHEVLEATDSYAQFNSKLSRINDSYTFFSSSANLDSLANSQRMEAPKVPILEIDNQVNVEDFYLFPTMSQFVSEVVRQLRVGQQRGKEIVRMKFLEPNIATGDPLYIIDGIATKNTEFFLSLNPKDLKTISVIKYPRKLSRFGLMAKNGIVIVNSKLGNIREELNPENLIYGLSRPLEFKELDETWAENSTKPEFRSTVYWNPSIRTDENGHAEFSFYTSDDQSPLIVIVKGMANGEPFTVIKKLLYAMDKAGQD